MREAGNTGVETSAAERDDAMATVLAGAHAAVRGYALVAGDVREEFATPVSAQLTDVAATVTEGSPEVYSEIQSAFDGADAIVEAAERIANAVAEAFAALYNDAKTNADTDERGGH